VRKRSGARAQAHGRTLFAFLFHPDCDRRPWHLTRSADPRPRLRTAGALAGSRIAADTAGGEFRPAL